MVVAVAIEHVVVDRLQRRGQLLRGELLLRQREPGIADEALVVQQDGGDVVVARDEPDQRLAVEARLAQNGVVLAHLPEGALRIGSELRAVEVVLPLRGRHLYNLRLLGRG